MAWAVKAEGYDGLGVYAARTAAGARGRAREACEEAGFEIGSPADMEFEYWRLWPLDDFMAAKAVRGEGQGLGVEHAIRQMLDARAEVLRAALRQLQKDGQGLVKDQEDAILGALGMLR